MSGNGERCMTGFAMVCVYVRIALHVALAYAVKPRMFRYNPFAYLLFLWRALNFLLIFRHNKVMRVFNGVKLHLYLPSYPSRAFFHTVEHKLIHTPPGSTTIVLSMTKACSYHCPHCYQKNDSGADLPEAKLLETARELQEAGVAMFDIEGGEPFLRFERLLALVQALDERAEVWLNTNGAGADRQQFAQLCDAGLFGIMVSIHSPDPRLHDAFTGVPGSFETACEILRICRDAGRVPAINCVMSEQEARAGELDRLMDLAKELGCTYVQLIHPKSAGAWLGKCDGMQTDVDLIHRLQDAHRLYNSGAKPGYPALSAQVFEERHDVLGCTSGAVDRFYINANGEVQPCEFLNISFGNLNDEPFSDILARMRSYFVVPCSDWLCVTQAQGIGALIKKHNLTRTPVPWQYTRELVENWDRGRPTPLYQRLGIYR